MVPSARSVYAKRLKRDDGSIEYQTLLDHTTNVMAAFKHMFGWFGRPTRLGGKWLSFFRLDQGCYDVFLRNTTAACVLHDLGKANSGFQAAVMGDRDAQVIRHEHLSALLLAHPTFQHWLPLIRVDDDIVIPAVAGHHLKAGRETFAEPLSADRTSFQVDVEGMYPLANFLSGLLEAEPAILAGISERWSVGPRTGCCDTTPLQEGLRGRWHRLARVLRTSETKHRLLMAVRAALVLADSAGSGLQREGKSAADWLSAAFDPNLLLDGEMQADAALVASVAERAQRATRPKQTCGRGRASAAPLRSATEAS
jgi:CRISPR-associated endonuclease/helicase Cas3